MDKPKLTKDRMENAFRVYHTLADAARAMGVSTKSLHRACKREGVLTPAQIKQLLDRDA